MRETPILSKVKELSVKDEHRFHMPGHKGDTGFFGGELLRADLTEIPGADNLLNPSGAILESQELYARRINAKKVYYSVNGSTAAILAVFHALLRPGDKLIMGRDCHMSAVSGLTLTGAKPVFVNTQMSDSGVIGCVSPKDIEEMTINYPDSKGIYITYPNYFGLCCDLSEIARIAHDANMPLIVDSAHAAAFPYSSLLPPDPAECGADVWVYSLHKTLPAMNQCSALCLGYDSLISTKDMEQSFKLFMTTSPSYILLSSIDYAIAYMGDVGQANIFSLASAVAEFANNLDSTLYLPLYDFVPNNGAVYHDFTRVLIDVSMRGISGFLAREHLMEQGFFVELADGKHILLLLSIADGQEKLMALCESLNALPLGRAEYTFDPYTLPLTFNKITPTQAFYAKGKYLPIEFCEGRIAKESVTVYPPGIPAIIPGQEICADVCDYILAASAEGYDIIGLLDNKMYVTE